MPRKKRPDRTIKRTRLLQHRRVGLLGGSFNPAHEGHLHLSEQALRALNLDEIWWLVAPSNPFKPADSLAPYAERLARAQSLTAAHPHLFVSDFEQVIASYRTITTLKNLKKTAPHTQFIWIAGMDLIHQMHEWKDFKGIARALPLAFFERPPLRQGTRRARLSLNPHIRQHRNAGARQSLSETPEIMVFRRRHTVNQSATALRHAHKTDNNEDTCLKP